MLYTIRQHDIPYENAWCGKITPATSLNACSAREVDLERIIQEYSKKNMILDIGTHPMFDTDRTSKTLAFIIVDLIRFLHLRFTFLDFFPETGRLNSVVLKHPLCTVVVVTDSSSD